MVQHWGSLKEPGWFLEPKMVPGKEPRKEPGWILEP